MTLILCTQLRQKCEETWDLVLVLEDWACKPEASTANLLSARIELSPEKPNWCQKQLLSEGNICHLTLEEVL